LLAFGGRLILDTVHRLFEVFSILGGQRGGSEHPENGRELDGNADNTLSSWTIHIRNVSLLSFARQMRR
jgi:hypothetical protein